MNDRRVLRRYLALVHHAEDVLEESLHAPEMPAPAEAAAELDELIGRLEPSVSRMQAMAPEASDILQQFAGWVH